MVGKPDKVLCCTFLLVILEVVLAQNLVKTQATKGGHVCSYRLMIFFGSYFTWRQMTARNDQRIIACRANVRCQRQSSFMRVLADEPNWVVGDNLGPGILVD